MTEKELSIESIKVFKKQFKCSIIRTEKIHGTASHAINGERPDVYGVFWDKSIIGEIKRSRSDCKHEIKKNHYPVDSMGNYRYIISEIGVLREIDIPESYGWIEVTEKGYEIKKVAPKRELNDAGKDSERQLLMMFLRKKAK